MNRNILLGFLSGLVFTASLVIGLIVADATTDQGGGEPRLPGALGDPVELAGPSASLDPDTPIDSGDLLEPTQAAFIPVDSGRGGGGGGGSSGGGSPAGGGSGTDGTTPSDTTELTVAPLAPVDADLPPGVFFTGDLFFELLEFGPFRFLDLCADDGGLPGCPLGIGGTVLAPLGGGLDSLGDFRLGSDIRSVFDVRNNCEAHYPAAEDEHPLFVWANHPAVFEITYNWSARRDLTETVTVSNADFEHPEFLRFTEDAVEGRLASSAWPRECFLLTEIPVTLSSGDSTFTGNYTVEVNATSFTGETASETYAFNTGTRARPPTYFWDRDDHSLDVLVPKKSDQSVGVSVIHESAATACADFEADGWDFSRVIPAEESGYLFPGLSDPIDQGPDWPYDSAYTRRETINVVDLEEGTAYLICIWWFETAERSFDGSDIVERETMWVTTPNRLTASVLARSVDNFTSRTLSADSYELGFSCASDPRSLTFPPREMIIHEHLEIPGAPVLCEYSGREIRIPTIGHFVTPGGTRQNFALALDPTSPRGFQTFEVELSTTEEPGPTLTFNAYFTQGSDSGGNHWQFGTPRVFEPLPDEPEELPAEIRIDNFASGVDPDGRDGIRVTAQFDRPVHLSASLLGDPCLTGPEPSYTLAGFSPTYDFRLDGLCLRTRYSVVLEVEDAAGNTASFADVAPGLPEHPGATYFRGTGWTDGYHVAYEVWNTGYSSAFSAPPHVARFEVAVDGERWDMRRGSRCLLENLPDVPGFERRGGSPDAVWGEEVAITITFTAVEPDLADGSPGCTASDRFRHELWTASLSSTFPALALELDPEFEVRVPITATNPYDSGSTITLDLVIVGRVTG